MAIFTIQMISFGVMICAAMNGLNKVARISSLATFVLGVTFHLLPKNKKL